MNEKNITWLHLSDWHQDLDSSDRPVLLKALIEDIKQRKLIDPSLENIDFLFFSGDLANSGKDEEFSVAIDSFLTSIFDVLGFKDNIGERFFITPGNHDLDRSELDLLNKELTEEELLQYMLVSKTRERLLIPFENYKVNIENIFQLRTRNISDFAYGNLYNFHYRNLGIAIVSINTAWRSGRKVIDDKFNDYGYLSVGEHQIYKAIHSEGFSQSDITICLMHHPVNWLGEKDQTYISDVLESNFDFILMGHQHISNISIHKSPNGTTIYIPAGSSYAGRIPDHPIRTNSYNYFSLNLQTNNGKIFFRRWSEKQRKWISDTDTAENGMFPLYDLQIGISGDRQRKLQILRTISFSFIDENYEKILKGISNVNEKIFELKNSFSDEEELRYLDEEIRVCTNTINYYSKLRSSHESSSQTVDFHLKSKNLRERNLIIGKTTQLDTLLHYLRPEDSKKLIVLYGPSGVGKSSLATELCYQALENNYIDFVIF